LHKAGYSVGPSGAGNEINGLTMGGVGRGTLIDHVEVYCNGDDAFEWFGGTVDTKFLISLWNNDDSFDIDEGFTGRGQFWFSLQGDDALNGDHGGEHDGTDANHNSVNLLGSESTAAFTTGDSGGGVVPAFITVYNATFIGSGQHANGTAGGITQTDSGANRAFRVRDSFNGIYRNSVFADFLDTPVRLNDVDHAGSFTVENSIFGGIDGTGAFVAYTSETPAAAGSTATAIGGAGSYNVLGNIINQDVFAVRRNGDPGFPPIIPAKPAKFDRRGSFNTGVNSVGFDPRPEDITAVTGTTA